jgi:ABC-type glycerol-3-phosphate transport system substrate-binding protein
MWKNGAWRGKPYGIPALDHGPELGLIWNTSLIAGAPPSTTNDLYQFARRLTRQDPAGAIQFLGFDPLDGVGGLLDTARDVVGQDWINAQSRGVQLSTPPYQAFLAALSGYYAAIGADRLGDFRQATSPMTDASDSAVNLGKQGAILTGYWSVAEVARLAKDGGWKFESTWAPTMAGGTTVQRLGGLVLTIPVVAKQPDDGWELIQHLASDETSGVFLDTVGTFAATRSFVNAGSWKKYPGLTFWIDSLNQASHLTSRSENSVASLAQERWTQAITDVLVNNKSPTDALNAAKSAIQAELNKLPNA